MFRSKSPIARIVFATLFSMVAFCQTSEADETESTDVRPSNARRVQRPGRVVRRRFAPRGILARVRGTRSTVVGRRRGEDASAASKADQLLRASENIQQLLDQWRRFWFLDDPEYSSPLRTNGGIL